MTITLSMKRLFALASAATLVLCAALPSSAQTAGNGTISGTVTDSSGAVVPNAAVIITDTDTGISRTTATDGAGTYTAAFLQTGHYEVVLGGGSFAKVDRKNLVLTVGETLTVDAALPASSVSTEVVVTSDTPILDPQKTEVAQTLDSNFIANLPVATRNWSSFVLLTPNVTQDGGSGLVSFHGISGLYNQNYVDGANNNQMLFSEARGRASGAPFVYSVDSIKEFQADTSNYSVEFGQAAGGQVNAITKSGTNAIHGDLFYELRYPTLNALDPYTKFQALHNQPNPVIAAFLLTQPTHQQQEFGGSVGGPIIKDRLFYFFTYDGFRKVGKALYTDSNTISLTPALASNSNTITPQQCPATITGHPATTATLDPNAGGAGTQCNAAIQFLINQSTAAPTRFAKEDLFFPRLDWHVSNKNDAFVDFNFANFQSSYGYSPAATFSNSSPSTNATTYYHERFLVGGLTTQIGKGSVNEFHGQWGRDLETAGSYAAGPNVGIGSSGSLVDSYGMPNALPRKAEPDEHRIQISDVFSTTKGHHTLKVGGDANIVHELMINLFQGGGIYGYGDSTPLLNFQDWAADSFVGQPGDTDPYAGYHYNSFIQTVDVVNTTPGTQGKDDFWMKMYDGFAEDNWKVTPNFTLTAGVRYDIQLTPNPGLVNHLFDPISSEYTSSIKNVTDRVQPRVAFSWSPYPGTVVRGGYGLFSALNQGSTYYAMRVENGVVQLNYSYAGCKSSVGTVGSTCPTPPTTSTKLRFPNVPVQNSGPPLSGALYPSGGTAPAILGPTVNPAYSFHGLDPNFVPPLAHEMNMSVEQALPGKMSLQVGYVGTRGMRLPVFIDSNLIGQTPHGVRTYTVQDANNNVTKTITVPVYLPTDRRNQLLSSFNTGFSVANTWYNSMAVTVRRPFANGFEALMNYTWAKATDTGQVGGANGTFYGGDTPSDPNNIRADNGPSDTDIRNRMTLSFVYQPKIMEDNKIVKLALDDFKFSGSEIASGGEPIFLGVSGTIYQGNTANTASNPTASYADESGIYGGAISSSSGSATSGRPPQIGRNSIYLPGYNDFDLRVSRDIPIYDNVHLEFAADAFNLLNHQIITAVNSTYTTFLAPNATAQGANLYKCQAVAVPSGSSGQTGCFVPYTGTGLSAFDVPSSTSGSILFGSRQMQFSAHLIF